MPYLWQAHTEGEWMSFTKAENENIEKAFCGKQDIVDSEIQIGSKQYKLHIHFDNEYFGVVYKIADFSVQKGRQMKIRRLSTTSFAKMIKEACPTNDTFCTQWRWYFKGNIGHWIPYRKAEEQSTLERKYLSGQRFYLYSRDTNGYQYRINFDAMDQVNIQNGTTRPLLRRPLYVPEENVRKNKFPQSLMVDVPTDLPSHWSPLDISGVEYELVELESGLEFRKVQESFFEKLDENLYDVDMIYRVQNSRLWKSYSMKKLFMTHKARLSNGDQTIDERDLFHHAESLERCSKIFTNSFDSRMSATDAMFCCGKGAHFTLNSNIADQWANRNERKRLMLRAKVLVGNYTKGKRSFECPPFIPGEGYSLFDSCVDDVTSPQIFVTFDTNQSYPEYLIQYTVKEESNDHSVTLCPSPENTSAVPCLPDSCSAFNPMMRVTELSPSSREVEKVTETDNISYHNACQELLTQEEQVHIPFPTQKDMVPTEVHIKEEFVAKASATHEASDPTSVSTQKELVTKSQPLQEEMVDNLSPTREKLIQKVSPLQEEFVQNDTVRNQDNLNKKGDLSAVEDVIPTVSTVHDQLVSEVGIAQALSNSKVAYQKEPTHLHPDSTSCNPKMIQIVEGHFQKDIASDELHRVPISENISSTLIDQDTALKMFQSKSEEINQEMQITPARLAQNSEITRDGILPKQSDAENRKLVEKKNCTSLNTPTGRQSENERKPLANDKQKKGKNCRVQ
ncbi:hypothetical protein FSP39_010098 [Pinctada imbricata]|uniref:Poly [ADP-ribose] polymerase n=1 Tax=Pinctada imbricata TaxID=66713 RepID=A0AA89C2B0_PINIB|nr:hypothetical protein FSP39_010098 [Pinctada imbricata]